MNKQYFASFASVCAVTSVLISSPAWAGHFVRLQQVDPAPYNEAGNLRSYTNISLRECEAFCSDNSRCRAYYWVKGNCWLKQYVDRPKKKTAEDGVGGIWID